MKLNERKIEVEMKLHNGDTYTASDDNNKEGSNTLVAIEHKKIVSLTDNGSTVFIPFHAIEEATKSMTVTEVTVDDDFCVSPDAVPTIKVDANVSDSVDLFGKVASDLQENVAVNFGSIVGTLKHVTGYTGFSDNPAQQEGHYLVLHVEPVAGMTTTVTVTQPSILDSDGIIVLLIADTSQTVTVTLSKDGEVVATKVFSLTGLTLEV